jgi:aryl-alcohol dehydrogenase-like predicted oxidoreductase
MKALAGDLGAASRVRHESISLLQLRSKKWLQRSNQGERRIFRVSIVEALADPAVSLAQTALRLWLSQLSLSAVIPGGCRGKQARCHLGMLGQDALPAALLSQIERCWHEEWHRQVRTSIGEEGEENNAQPVSPGSSLVLPTMNWLLVGR